jgi:DnaK suppressor protein
MTATHLIPYQNLLRGKRYELARAGGSKSGLQRQEAVQLADFVDQSAYSIEESVQVRLRQSDSRLLKAIDAALYRIERGTFGVCVICMQDIPTRA